MSEHERVQRAFCGRFFDGSRFAILFLITNPLPHLRQVRSANGMVGAVKW